MPMPGDPVINLLLDMLGRLERIEAALGEHRQASALGRLDRELLTRLLPAVAAFFGSEPFTAKDLLEEPRLRPVIAGRNAKQIGKLLGRAHGPIDGFLVEKAGLVVSTQLWRVVRSIST